jgi:spore germination protein KC
MEVDIRAEDDLYENSSKLDLSQPEVIKNIEKMLEEDVKERIRMTIEKAQKLKADVFGFGSEVYRSHPKEWKKQFKERWDKEFPQLEVTVSADVKVVRTGLTSKSLMWDDKELKK